MNKVRIESIAKNVRKLAEPIILREGQKIRLIFQLLIIEKNNENKIKGIFIYQKKKKNDEWEDFKDIDLRKVTPGNYIKLELHSRELEILIEEIKKIDYLSNKLGPLWKKEYFVTDQNIGDIIEQLSKFKNKGKIISILGELDSNKINNIQYLSSISGLQKLINIWEKNIGNNKEDFWQNLFKEFSWILSQIFSSPFILIEDKPYFGGKDISNKGGVYGDFLYKNKITGNIAFIEIKTPTQKLLKGDYGRNGVYKIDEEITGGIIQVLNQRNTFLRELDLRYQNIKSYNSKCILLVGNSKELDNDDKRKTFELFRNNLKDVEIVMFDEMLEKVKSFLEVLKSFNNNSE